MFLTFTLDPTPKGVGEPMTRPKNSLQVIV